QHLMVPLFEKVEKTLADVRARHSWPARTVIVLSSNPTDPAIAFGEVAPPHRLCESLVGRAYSSCRVLMFERFSESFQVTSPGGIPDDAVPSMGTAEPSGFRSLMATYGGAT